MEILANNIIAFQMIINIIRKQHNLKESDVQNCIESIPIYPSRYKRFKGSPVQKAPINTGSREGQTTFGLLYEVFP